MTNKQNLQKESYLLKVDSLRTAFTVNGDFHDAVADVSFTIKPKQVLGVVGESGCGKSVMALSIMQLLPKDIKTKMHGDILFNDADLSKHTDKQMNAIRGKDISMIFQEPMTSLNPVFTIGSQVQEVLLNHEGLTKAEARLRSIALLRDVGISRPDKIIYDYPHQLSGGMRQRVMIAMAIACKPKLLIADEPTTALDVTVQAQILELIQGIQEENNMAVLMITHDLGVVAEICHEVIVMYAGKIVETANVVELFRRPKHPYTKLLMSAIPKMDEEQEVLATIEGVVPSIDQMPSVGCRFVNRCPQAMKECAEITPELASHDNDHFVRCLLYKESYPKGDDFAHVSQQEEAPTT
ncbi:ABC transporter ATP-binding protein [Aureibacillus halotolerans]|uniref:Oligopeptide/dipeptide ABC transporter ATP-binding protein n=1 Tax=Aureibacillus halotolerans TaxID=1508390 RepID=A0A4R6UG61_9BACI|nr:ABC transporter ATP-binding protein [Aureibacillus halotolerans]TDQ42124.1 oligopeptide/dipeptide ABC transporter ATP-binding protein [Aureibacillus halotolerans]